MTRVNGLCRACDPGEIDFIPPRTSYSLTQNTFFPPKLLRQPAHKMVPDHPQAVDAATVLSAPHIAGFHRIQFGR